VNLVPGLRCSTRSESRVLRSRFRSTNETQISFYPHFYASESITTYSSILWLNITSPEAQWSVLTAPSRPHWHAVDARLLQFSKEMMSLFITVILPAKSQIGFATSQHVFVSKIVLLSIVSWKQLKGSSTFIESSLGTDSIFKASI